MVVYEIPSGGWADPRQNTWAPEVHYYKGKYYLFGTNHNPSNVIWLASTEGQACGDCGQHWQNVSQRATIIAVSDSPDGPFVDLNPNAPITNPRHTTIDGTLYVDPEGKPWMVYSHEWLQKIDGTMEAIPLTDDLTAAAGDPIYLFKASDAPWYSDPVYGAPIDSLGQSLGLVNDVQLPPYVTDGPQLYETPNGSLLMLWSSYRKHNQEYVQTQAISRTGNLAGPWEQLDPIITGNKGHGMIFRAFDGQLILILHNNMNRPNVRAELYDVMITDNGVKVLRHREDIDGVPNVTIDDTTPPRLFLPPNRNVNATNPNGAIIQFTALAKDDVDNGWIPVVSSKPSGSLFPIGETIVTFTATDSSGNTTSPMSVRFYVKNAIEQIDDQIELAKQIKNSDLIAKLNKAKEFLSADNKSAAKSTLQECIGDVEKQSGNSISYSFASDLVNNMNRIISVIGEESIITPSPGPVTSPSVTPTEDGEIKVTNPDVKNGIAETSISATAITNAINTSVVDGDSGFKIATAKIPAIDGVNEYRIKLPAEAFNASKPDAKIRIITQVAQIDLPNNMLSNDEFSGENLIISVSEVDKTKLSEEVADKIGDRPVISINAYNENRKITWNNNDAPVTVSIKYQLKGIERISDEFLTVWYIDDDGNCYPITNARYDLKTGCITFNITHFSTYAVVYSRIKFKDLAKHNIMIPEIKTDKTAKIS